MRKKYLIIGAIATVVLILLALIVNSTQKGTLEITIPETPNNVNAEVVITYDDKSTEHITIPARTTRNLTVKTGTHRVNSLAGEVKAVDVVKITAASTTKLAVKLSAQRTATKIGTDAEYCPYMVGDTLFSYNCQGDGFIYRHPGADNRKIPIIDAQFFAQVTPYNAGFLGYPITDPNDSSRISLQLSFINPKAQTIQKIALPAGLPLAGVSDRVQVVTSNDPSKTAFALVVRETSTIYLFKNLDDKNPAVIPLPENKKLVTGAIGLFSFSGDTLVAYVGNAVHGENHDGQEDETTSSAPPDDHETTIKSDGRIFEFSVDGKLTKTIHTPDDFDVNALTKLTDNYYVSLTTPAAVVYYLRNNTLENIYSLSDSNTALVTKGKLYMVVSAGIFEFIPKDNGTFSLQNVFNSNNMRVSGLYAGPDLLIFTAFEGDSTRAKLNIFTLK